MDTLVTRTVTPAPLRDGWILVQEFSLATGDLLTVSLMADGHAHHLPAETDSAACVLTRLGTVLVREAPGCCAPDRTHVIVTFGAHGRSAQYQ